MQEIYSVEEFQCAVRLHPRFNYSRGIIYIHEFDVDNTEEFKDYLQRRYSIIDMQSADFIKPRTSQTKTFIVTFDEERVPYNLYISGEWQDTKVYAMKNKPIMCYNCQAYGHTRKWCKNNMVCRRCAAVGQDMEKCSAEYVRCHYCWVATWREVESVQNKKENKCCSPFKTRKRFTL